MSPKTSFRNGSVHFVPREGVRAFQEAALERDKTVKLVGLPPRPELDQPGIAEDGKPQNIPPEGHYAVRIEQIRRER